MTWDEFIEETKKLGININKEQEEKLKKFSKLLTEWNKRINLTRITEENEIYEKHFYDSLTLSKVVSLKEEKTLLDIGTGAGFPGIVLKICYPNLKITLIDSLLKRVNYLNEIIKELDLKEIEAIHTRAEFYKQENKKFDIVTSRAVAKLPKLLNYALPFLKKEGIFVAMKASVEEEIKDSQKILNQKNYQITQIKTFTLPKEKSLRNLVVIQRK